MIISVLSCLSWAQADESYLVTKHSAGHRSFHSEIVVAAPPEAVWSVLTDFDTYPDWSYQFTGMEGRFGDGERVTVQFERKPGVSDKVNRYDHVLTVVEGESFGWSDVFAAGMTDRHVYRVVPRDDGTTLFVQDDEASGGLTWLFGRTVSRFHQTHYPLFNRALKAEVERRYPRAP